MSIDIKDCMTSKETAAELRIDPDTLCFWRMKGKGPKFIKLGMRVYYERAEVDRYMSENTKKYGSTAQAKVGQREKKK